MAIHIVLVEPEIPQNTGSIARTCAATGTTLHLVKPLGFSTDEKHLKRAGLDYWHLVDIHYHDSIDEIFTENPDSEFYFATTKAPNKYSDVQYSDNCFIFFGKETAGLPEELLKKYHKNCIRIPMIEQARSLNLSNSVSILLYEALRQTDFMNLLEHGNLGDNT